MSVDEALPIVLQMASALQAAHEREILHRDFKPGNVFLVPIARKLESKSRCDRFRIGARIEFAIPANKPLLRSAWINLWVLPRTCHLNNLIPTGSYAGIRRVFIWPCHVSDGDRYDSIRE